jgi:hypothetical protein
MALNWCVECSYNVIDTYWLCAGCVKQEMDVKDSLLSLHSRNPPACNFYMERRFKNDRKKRKR